MSTSAFCLLLSGPVVAVGLLRYRADLRRRGRTTSLGVTLLLAAWLMPHPVLGRDASTLVTDGPYRWSRNPQYVTYLLLPVGYALTGSAVMAWVGVALLLVLVHLTVLVEEEHLEGRFGDRYRAYRRATPRYLFR
jgi:protein-S-isoprenylcysteine O-methyltransferase Ste14